jgi:hypothetical protein
MRLSIVSLCEKIPRSAQIRQALVEPPLPVVTEMEPQ